MPFLSNVNTSIKIKKFIYKRDEFDNISGQIMTDNFMPIYNP